jgi:hypothetical protein
MSEKEPTKEEKLDCLADLREVAERDLGATPECLAELDAIRRDIEQSDGPKVMRTWVKDQAKALRVAPELLDMILRDAGVNIIDEHGREKWGYGDEWD